MRKSKKKLTLAIAACALTLTLAFGGTMAYMTDSEGVTNTVTVGQVSIDLEEPGYPGNDSDEVKNVIPNQEVIKDPQVENTGINDALVFLRVEIPLETYTDEDDGTWTQKKQDLFRLKDVSDQWELLRTETITGTDGKEKTSYVYGYKKALAKNSTTDKLFQKVQMKNAMESDLSGNVEDIVVTACAIQATDIPDIDLTPGSDGTIDKDALDQVYEIFLKQSGDAKARPADEGNKPQDASIGKINYELNGGTIKGAKKSYTAADYGYVPPTPTKKNYSFTGWEPENIPAGSTGNVTLTAKWTPTVLGSISYNLSGGSLDDKKTSYTVEDYGYTPSAPTKENYTFNGWSPASIPSGSTGTVTLTAKWTADVLGNISYNLDGGSISGEKASYTAEDYGYAPPTPKKNGFTFDGWTPKTIPSGNKGDVTFTANWIAETLGSIRYDLDGGTLTGEKTSYSSLDYGYTPPTPIKAGYKFTGWNPAKVPSNSTGDVTFTASWTEETSTFSSTLQNVIYNKNSTITAFRKSSVAPDLTNSSAKVVSTSDSDVPIYAWYEGSVLYWWSNAPHVNAPASMSSLFSRCGKLADISGVKDWDTHTTTSMSSAFYQCTALKDLSPLLNWNVENVTKMSGVFMGCSSIVNLHGLETWNTKQVNDLGSAFDACTSLADITALKNWNTAKVENMRYLFCDDTSLTSLSGLEKWDLRKVRTDRDYLYGTYDNTYNASELFKNCSSLNDISALANWDLSNITRMSSVFEGCKSLTSLSGLKNWNMGNKSLADQMFKDCRSLVDISALANWNTSKMYNIKEMFSGCQSLVDISVLARWDVSNVGYITAMFNDCRSIRDLSPLANWNMGKVSSAGEMFKNCRAISDLSPLANWDVGNMKDISDMFAMCISIPNVNALAKWNTSSVTNMSGLFVGDETLSDISGLSNWQTSNVTNISHMFSAGIDMATNQNYYVKNLTNVDALAKWDISSVTAMYYLFSECRNLSDISGLANWNTAKVTSMENVFYNCSLSDLTALAKWDTSKVTTMKEMFYRNYGLRTLNGLQNWNTAKVVSMNYIFAGCRNLKDVSAVSSWKRTSLRYSENAFQDCKASSPW